MASKVLPANIIYRGMWGERGEEAYKGYQEADVVVHWVKPLLCTPASHTGVLAQVHATSLSH